ncbi:MAG: integration host factor subunit beta [Candidatus Omnitrophica bacterium]|nr:integration host factor subunit beta [Candidatus Omnitrophota bacterium]
MTKKDIVVRIADEAGVKQTDVKKVVQKYLDYVIDSLAKGETVELRNFGVFKVKTRKGRMGRNPRTGDAVPIPEKKVVTFKPGLVMKQRVK